MTDVNHRKNYGIILIGVFHDHAFNGRIQIYGWIPGSSAYISGTNEFSPGTDVQLPVTIENTGLNEFKFVQSGIVDWDDLPNTAKFLTVTLLPGDAPSLSNLIFRRWGSQGEEAA